MVSDVDPAVAEANRRVAEEMERFDAALPKLLLDDVIRGRWVVFKDGAVVRAFDDEDSAYTWARNTLGKLAGFVLACVEPERTHVLGAASGFRLVDDDA
jgi:hypothetical protein